MVEWTHAERDCKCGLCGALIQQGDQVRVTTVDRCRAKFLRCQECVGGAPPELRSTAATAAPARAMEPLQSAMPPRTRGGLRRFAGSPLKAVGE